MPSFSELIQTASTRPLSQEERDELLVLLETQVADEMNRELIADSIARLNTPDPAQHDFIANMLESIFSAGVITAPAKTVRLVHRVHFIKTAWFRYAAAIILISGIGAYLWNTNKPGKTAAPAETQTAKADIQPGGEKATLTLADGSIIILDSTQNGQLAVENGSEIIKKDGQVIYNAGQLINNSVAYNTMSTPKGGQYQLTLSDGTKVWLNAASKIIYPAVFNDKTREVKIEGEVYFEVAKNKEKPFIVKTSKEEITVLGTSFNINNYPDEPVTKISLAEGSVKVNDKLLSPGQAYINGKITQTNIAQDIAWKNGVFNFSDADIQTIMRQLQRWYDIKVEYGSNVPVTLFSGEFQRQLKLSEVLEALALMQVHFELKGKTLYVQ